MGTCVGCGGQLAPTWKYCIHCGIATDAHEIAVPSPKATNSKPLVLSSRVLVTGGAIIFSLAITLLVVTIVYLRGGFG